MRGDHRTDPTPELLDHLLRDLAEELWSIVAEEAVLLQRKAQAAEAANRLRPVAISILRRQRARKSNGEVLTHPTALTA